DLKRIIRKTSPDILIAYRITSYGYIAAKTSFHPLVLAAQNEQITYTPEKSFFRQLLLSKFAKFAISKADMLHAWSENIKNGLLKFGADPEKILVMHRGINTEIFSPATIDDKKKSLQKPVFISTRSLEKEYLLDNLIQAFAIVLKKVPEAVLKIAGEGSEKQHLVELVSNLKISNNVIFLGKIAPRQLAHELRSAHAYVSLIRTEGMSSSLIECCSCGTIPIVADISASRELVTHGNNGILLENESVAHVAEMMLESLKNPKLIENSLLNAENTRKRFDRKTNLEYFVRRYRELAGAPPTGDLKIHICHVTTSHAPDDIRIFQRECRSLAQIGYKVSLIARVRKKTLPYEQDGVNIIPLRYILGKPGRKIILPKLAATKARQLRADIYHFHDPELMPWMCIMAKNYPVKIIWDAHELYSATIKEFYIRNPGIFAAFLAKYYEKLEKLWCANFAGVVAVTDPIKEYYQRIGAKRCVTVKNTIDLKNLPEPAVEKEKFFSIISSGTTNSSRCIIEVIHAFEILKGKVPDIRLNLISCFDSEKSERSIRKEITDRGLATNIKIFPPVPWRELMSKEIPRNHLGLVLYAKSENNLCGIPNRLFEYWACGIPVIATDTPLLKKIVEGENGGITVNSEDPAKIAEAIMFYVENRKQLEIHGSNGQKAVFEKYNWANDFSGLQNLYTEILNEYQNHF
ncbi:MAG: glycosyltransferase, partial [Candidatus Nanoarchaeia archaeon]